MTPGELAGGTKARYFFLLAPYLALGSSPGTERDKRSRILGGLEKNTAECEGGGMWEL